MIRFWEKIKYSRSGETIGETLVALLIAVTAIVALATAIVSSANINKETREMKTEFIEAAAAEEESMLVTFKDESESGSLLSSGSSTEDPDGNITVKVDKYKTEEPESIGPYVYYGKLSGDEPITTVFVVYKSEGALWAQIAVDEDGHPVLPESNPEKEGYTFKGWKKSNGEELKTSDVIEKTIIATPDWETTKKKITINTGSKSKTYDGDALTYNYYSVSGELAPGDSVTGVTVTGRITNVGTADNTASGARVTRSGQDVTDEYDITYSPGTLTVNPISVTVTADSTGKTYGGKDPEFTATVKGLLTGDSITYECGRKSGEDVGTYKITPHGETTQGNYTVTYVDADFVINPKTLKVTTPGAEKTYDGTALTKSEGAKIEGLVNGETATLTVTGSQTNAGESDNTYSIIWGTANKDNYTIDETVGTLKVTKASMTVNVVAENVSVTYDGKSHTATKVELTSDSDLFDSGLVSYTSRSKSSINAIDKSNIGYTASDFSYNNSNIDVTFIVTDGSLEINKAKLKVTTLSDTKVYDGTALTADGEISGFVNGETATFTTTGSQTDAGESKNTYSITWGTTNKDNYTIDETVGTLKVTKAGMTVIAVAENVSVTYDGKSHTATNVTLSSDSELFDSSLVMYSSKSKSSTNAIDKSNIGYTASDFSYNNGNIDVTFNVTDGSLEIKKAPNTITATTTQSGSVDYSTSLQTVTITAASCIDGSVSYSKNSGDSYFSVNSSSGAITVAEKTPAGEYTIEITVTSPDKTNYYSQTKTITYTLTVNPKTYTIYVHNFSNTNSATVSVIINGETKTASLGQSISNVPAESTISYTVELKQYSTWGGNKDYNKRYVIAAESSSSDSQDDIIYKFDTSNVNKYSDTYTMPEHDVYIGGYASDRDFCIAEGTLITLADGTQKPVEEITANDLVLVFNHETGKLDKSTMPLMVHNGKEAEPTRVMTLVFDDGTELRIVEDHGLFDIDAREYVYINAYNYSEYIGRSFYKESYADGSFISESVKLSDVYFTEETIRYYAPISQYHLNYFADGMLSMTSLMEGLFNIFELDDNMKYDEEKMKADIEEYGLLSYEDYIPYGVYPELYEYFPSKYFGVAIGKGMITMEHIFELADEYVIPENFLMNETLEVSDVEKTVP